MIEVRGSFLPWFINKVEWTGFNEGIISFDEITSPERARMYSGCELFLTEKDAETYFKKNKENLHYLLGYRALDEKMEEIGLIEDVVDNPGQILLSVKKEGKEIIIPYVEDFVIKLDKRKKELVLNLPEGLLDL
jgi:16S rRNA processing protein RimM